MNPPGILILGMFLAVLSPLFLVLLQMHEDLSPNMYYAADAASGLVSWLAVALSSLSDAMPPHWRAASFGLLLAGFSLGIALSPSISLFMTRFQVSVLSLCVTSLGLVFAVFFLPETLSPENAAEARRARREELQNATSTTLGRAVWTCFRPVRELMILNRNGLLRLLTALAFFSGIVTASDQSLLLYYVQGQYAFTTHDIAILFLIYGIGGILVQGVFLKPINDVLGERLVVVLSFFLGAVNNVVIGVAPNKATIFASLTVGSFAGMSFPTISAIKSNNVVSSRESERESDANAKLCPSCTHVVPIPSWTLRLRCLTPCTHSLFLSLSIHSGHNRTRASTGCPVFRIGLGIRCRPRLVACDLS